MRLRRVSRLCHAYNQIRVGMSCDEVGQALERYGWLRARKISGIEPFMSLVPGAGLETDEYEAVDGEKLTIEWKSAPWTFSYPMQDMPYQRHVIGKEYHSGIEAKLRDLSDRIRRMLHW